MTNCSRVSTFLLLYKSSSSGRFFFLFSSFMQPRRHLLLVCGYGFVKMHTRKHGIAHVTVFFFFFFFSCTALSPLLMYCRNVYIQENLLFIHLDERRQIYVPRCLTHGASFQYQQLQRAVLLFLDIADVPKVAEICFDSRICDKITDNYHLVLKLTTLASMND